MIDRKRIDEAYEIATKARAMNLDPAMQPEIVLAPDLAARVEGIVGPPGVADKIRSLKGNRTQVAFEIAAVIVRGELGSGNRERILEQAVRTGTAILTEGVLVAPTEGIAGVYIRKNPDGTEYVAVSYAGPIRAAGGTAAALSVVLADYCRRMMNIGEYRPTETVLARYLEEMYIYDMRAARLQYKPTDEEFKHIIANCPVMIDGEPTEEYEVSVHRDVETVGTNRVRGGMCLVSCEGIAQKASKVLKVTRNLKLDWNWLETIIKVPKSKEKTAPKPNDKFLDELAAGRPIFSYPSRWGGFRLRYGRSMATGITGKAIHPATMVILDSFPAIGTQMKIERPGKGCIITPCDTLEGPIVKLADGSIIRIESVEEAKKVKDSVESIIYLGDILATYGDFLKSNTPLFPAGYCEEWWALEVEKACNEKKVKNDIKDKSLRDLEKITAEEAIKISEHLGVPLHPRYTYFWINTTGKDIKELIEWLRKAEVKSEWFHMTEIRIKCSPAKEILEKILLPHRVEKDEIIVNAGDAMVLFKVLGLHENVPHILSLINDEDNGLDSINKISKIRNRDKAGTWIGTRMGRPEKSKERMMKPAPHVLFPIGMLGGKVRDMMKLHRDMGRSHTVAVEIARMRCQCGNVTFMKKCEKCGKETKPERVCPKCNMLTTSDICKRRTPNGEECGARTVGYEMRDVDVKKYLDEAIANCKFSPEELKGVMGMTSDLKIPERLEKGILRAKHKVFVFKDGTCRFDATNAPLTHFYPREIGVSLDKLKEMGYTKDAYGKDLVSDSQLVEMDIHDMLVSERCIDYLYRVANFIDDLLVIVYKQEPYYKLKDKKDLVGQMIIHLSPHTSCGISGRIIGTTKAHVCYAHPVMFAASRRNCDGDENCVMLMMDGLLNFSKCFLPKSRGGTMDAPLVLMTHIDPKEVDDEVHSMETVRSYPIELYEASMTYTSPSDINVEKVSEKLGKPDFKDIWFTHEMSSIHDAVITTSYVTLKTMREKIDAQLNLGLKIKAVDARDAAERVIVSHFLPDLYGNLHSYSRQQFRCVNCNMKYRRMPLIGKCRKCGGKLILTINRGGVEKYLKLSQFIAEEYNLPQYLKQRLELLSLDIKCMFEDETEKQFNLAEYM
jgi:DNA polymerase II large subunit